MIRRFSGILCFSALLLSVSAMRADDSLVISPVGPIDPIGPLKKVGKPDPVNDDAKKRSYDTKAWTVFTRKKAADDAEPWEYYEDLFTGGEAKVSANDFYKKNGDESLAFPFKVDPDKWKKDRDAVVNAATDIVEAKRLQWVKAKWVDVPVFKRSDMSGIKLKLAPGVKPDDQEMLDKILKHAKELRTDSDNSRFLGTWGVSSGGSQWQWGLYDDGTAYFFNKADTDRPAAKFSNGGTWKADGDNISITTKYTKFVGALKGDKLEGKEGDQYTDGSWKWRDGFSYKKVDSK